MKKHILLYLLLTISILAGNGYSYGKSNKKKNKSTTSLEQNRYEMTLDKNMAIDINERRDNFKRTMRQTYNLELSKQPLKIPFGAIIHIHITTQYQTTIMFPERFRIQGALPSEEFAIKKHSENNLYIKPKRDFLEGNINVSLTDGEKNIGVDIILDRHLPHHTNPQDRKSKYAKGNQFVSTVVKLIDKPKINDYELLQLYFKMAECPIPSLFKNNGDFDIVQIEGIPFYIIRDDIYGSIFTEGVNFTIANEYLPSFAKGGEGDMVSCSPRNPLSPSEENNSLSGSRNKNIQISVQVEDPSLYKEYK